MIKVAAKIIKFNYRNIMIKQLLKANKLTEKQMTNLYKNYIKRIPDISEDAKNWRNLSLLEISILVKVLK